MKIASLTLPEDPAQLADWLERRLVGADLGDLAAELMVERSASAGVTLQDLFPGRLEQILARGLQDTPPEQLEALLNQPALLLDLQHQIFVAGGGYWRSISPSKEHRQAAERVQRAVQASAGTSLAGGPAPVKPFAPPAEELPRSGRRQLAILALAASLLIGVGLWVSQPTGPQLAAGWGFNRPGLLAQEESGPEYLTVLAEAAGDWFKKQPDSIAQLEQRLQQFRNGCNTLLAMPHEPLAQVDKEWLTERCEAWRDRIDQELAQLKGQQPDLAEQQSQADAIVRALIEALNQRAELVAHRAA